MKAPKEVKPFVTKKICEALCKIKHGKQKTLYVGNLYSKRDWGHAKDYVKAMWLMLQQRKPDDYVVATGKQYSVKYFINLVCKILKIDIIWKGQGLNEVGIDKKSKKIIIRCDKKYFRPTEVDSLLGNSNKARKKLGWRTTYNIKKLVKEMVAYELDRIND